MRSRGAAMAVSDSLAGKFLGDAPAVSDESADACSRVRLEQTFDVWFT